jgi:hypothetical protein
MLLAGLVLLLYVGVVRFHTFDPWIYTVSLIWRVSEVCMKICDINSTFSVLKECLNFF